MNLRTFGGATRARLERRFHRESGRLHWVAAAVGLRSAALIGRRERGGVYVVLGKIPASDDSCQRALLSCFAAFADAGVLVHLLLLDYARDADYTINGLRDRSLLPAAVTVRYFWRDAAPSWSGCHNRLQLPGCRAGLIGPSIPRMAFRSSPSPRKTTVPRLNISARRAPLRNVTNMMSVAAWSEPSTSSRRPAMSLLIDTATPMARVGFPPG